MKNKTVGILVDVENSLSPTVLSPIIRAARSSSSLTKLALFGNWKSPHLAPWNEPQIKKELESWGAVWFPLPMLRPGKNAADIALTCEATMMAQNGTVNEIWIVSGDSDFTPLVERLERNQIRVVVCGPKNTPPALRTACSTFILIDDVQKSTKTDRKCARTQPSLSPPDQREWLHGFVKSVGNQFGFIQASPSDEFFFCASTVDSPMIIQDLRSGDPVEFKLGCNHKGRMAVQVRKTFALRTA